MNMLSRDELAQSRDAYEEGAEVRCVNAASRTRLLHPPQCRARTWLFFAYLVATAAVATGVTMLIKGQETEHLEHAGVSALLQSCLVVLSSLLLWAFRTDDDAGNGYGFIA